MLSAVPPSRQQVAEAWSLESAMSWAFPADCRILIFMWSLGPPLLQWLSYDLAGCLRVRGKFGPGLLGLASP